MIWYSQTANTDSSVFAVFCVGGYDYKKLTRIRAFITGLIGIGMDKGPVPLGCVSMDVYQKFQRF